MIRHDERMSLMLPRAMLLTVQREAARKRISVAEFVRRALAVALGTGGHE